MQWYQAIRPTGSGGGSSGKGIPSPRSGCHSIPANVCGDPREELVVYNPWTSRIYIYTQPDNDGRAFRGYKAGPRQYNPRLMD